MIFFSVLVRFSRAVAPRATAVHKVPTSLYTIKYFPFCDKILSQIRHKRDCAGFVIRKTGILASESLFVIRSYHKSRKNFPLGPDSGHQLYTIRVLEGREAAGFVIRSYHEFGTGKHMKSTRELRIKHAPFESTLV